MLEKIEHEASNLPVALREKVMRQVRQIEEGQGFGLDMGKATEALSGEVARIKERLGLVPEVHNLHLPVKIMTPWGEGEVDEARRTVVVGDVEFSEKEVDILSGKGLGREMLGRIISAKREFQGRVVK